MIKYQELSDPNSCLNRAKAEERLFVLLARDVAAPDVIRYWVRRRLFLGKNMREDAQIQEALECARLMEAERQPGMASVGGSTPHDPAKCWWCQQEQIRQLAHAGSPGRCDCPVEAAQQAHPGGEVRK